MWFTIKVFTIMSGGSHLDRHEKSVSETPFYQAFHAARISKKVYARSFRKSQFPHKSINLSFIIPKQKVEELVPELTSTKRPSKHFM